MRTARSTAAISGFLIALLGIWGALVPFVGPYFDFAFGVNRTWHYTADRMWLDILPGVVAVAGGLMLLASSRRGVLLGGALLSLIAGAWFVVGPAVSLAWESAAGPIGRPLFASTRQMLELVGYFYGLGALIVALSAFSFGRVWTRATLVAGEATGAQPTPARAPAPEPVGAIAGPTTPTAQEPPPARQAPWRSRLLRRRGRTAHRERRPVERQR
jgi:hypothetical protein